MVEVNIKVKLREKERATLRKGMSRILTELGCPSSAKTVLRIKKPEHFRAIASVARGSFKARGGLDNPKVAQACVMIDELVKKYEKPLEHQLKKIW